MITSQAAAVLAAFRHSTGIVSVMSPDRMPEVMSNLAAAAAPARSARRHAGAADRRTTRRRACRSSRGIAAAFDDAKVAQLLATALALDGQASDRLATIFNTIAPDEDRKRRVLTLTRNLLSETDFGKVGPVPGALDVDGRAARLLQRQAVRLGAYRAALDGVGGRAERMAAGELPPELPEWMDTLGQDNVRALSVHAADRSADASRPTRRAPPRSPHDMAALAEDLLLSGAYDGRAGR